MNLTKYRNARFHIGTIEPGSRGPILRDDEGVCWRLGFADDKVPDELGNRGGKVRIRGRVEAQDNV